MKKSVFEKTYKLSNEHVNLRGCNI